MRCKPDNQDHHCNLLNTLVMPDLVGSQFQAEEVSTTNMVAGDGAQSDSGLLNRSCEPCRAAKVRCQMGSSVTATKCQRCQATNRGCVFIARLPRKPRKRTDTLIKELEQKLKAVESSLLKPPGQTGPYSWSLADAAFPGSRSSRTPCAGGSDNDSEARDALNDSSKALDRQPSTGRPPPTDYCPYKDPSTSAGDVVSRNVLSLSRAEGLFTGFVDHHMVKFPLVVLPAGTTAAEVRSSKPTLFLAIPAAASGSSDPSLFRALNVELLMDFAQKIMISSMKGLELVQAMLIMAAWYFPPDRFEDLKHYQYIHMAATMAMDIGLGEVTETLSPAASGTRPSPHGSPESVAEADVTEIDKCRTILSCYLLCAGYVLSAP